MTYIYILKKNMYIISLEILILIFALRGIENRMESFKIYLLKNRHLEQLVPRTRSNIVVITNPNDRRRNNRHS